ncbi:hypothetical protein B0T10DRAFT_492207 [Thelonectria olida]|uniref:F-box domain-containing protein n=1 Tax=Thelonectria olida TaxID=1576542 RepID=A0A9P8W263_9HYPO|nr:hypothetical protein B0T10DRAFT_492207 [Thelonectria olida]
MAPESIMREIAGVRDLIQTIARKKPDDEEAQFQARAAAAFCESETFPLDEDTVAEQRPHFGHDSRSQIQMELPPEVYRVIFDHIEDFDSESRHKTLIAVASTCKTMQALAEPHIYAYPRALDTVDRLNRFAFVLAIKPHLAKLVRSLHLDWTSSPYTSSWLFTNIAAACSNLKELSVERKQNASELDRIGHEDVFVLAALLDACPHVTSFSYSSFVEWRPEERRYGNLTRTKLLRGCRENERFRTFARFASQLVELTLRGQVQWLLEVLIPHVASSLRSLNLGTVGHDIDFNLNPGLLSNVSRQSPYLDRLEVQCAMPNATDLEEACRAWGASLRTLRVFSIENADDWIPRVIPSLVVLKALSLGLGCHVSIRNLGIIAASLPTQRFTSLSFGDVQDPGAARDLVATQTELDNCLVRITQSHSITLRDLEINSGEVKLGRVL